jgi:competence protein ComGC
MRNSGSTNGAGSGRGASDTNHPLLSRAVESIGLIARITRVRGARGLVLAEKSGLGWTRRSAGRGRQAFTRVELCACLAAGALLLALALPALATSQSRGQVAQCLNNLRLMGRAVQMFAGDHVGQPSWRTYDTDGGTRPSVGTKPGAAWFEFTALSNELVTPRILACPADTGVKIAAEFSNNGASGYLSTGFRSQATSYFITLDPPSGSATMPPAWPVFGDRNVRFSGTESCALGINSADRLRPYVLGSGAWTNAVHGIQGNVVKTDGSVSETSSDHFRELLGVNPSDDSVLHFLRAR